MRTNIFILLLFFSILTYSQDFQISNLNGYSVDIPHIAISDNSAHVTMGLNFYCYNFAINGPSSPIDSLIVPANNYGPNTVDIATNPNNSSAIAIAYIDYHYDYTTQASFYGCYVVESNDGGRSWDTPTLLDTIMLGNSLDNIMYNMPQVKYIENTPYILWRVHQNSTVTNGVYLGTRTDSPSRIDDPSNDDLELALDFRVENNIISISYGKEVDGHAMFYLTYSQNGLPGFADTKFVKDDGQTFLTSEHLTKAFLNTDGTIYYIYNDFTHGPNVEISNDWGANWTDAGTAEAHKYIFVAFDRISPEYFIKLFLNNSNDLVYYVSNNLINWQYAGKLNSDGSSVEGYAGSFIDLKCNASDKYIVSTWIDNRTGNSELFYGKGRLPDLVSVNDKNELPTEFSLEQNYPNPFNPSTTIKYSLANDDFVSLTIFNAIGQQVATLVNSEMSAGIYQTTFDASNLPSGTYLYALKTSKFTSVKKMLLIK